MEKLTRFLANLPPGRLLTLCLALVSAIGITDYYTGSEMNVTMLYLAPIFVAAWTLGTNAAVVMSIISMTAWFVSVLYMHQTYSQPLIHVWDGFIQFAMFVLF